MRRFPLSSGHKILAKDSSKDNVNDDNHDDDDDDITYQKLNNSSIKYSLYFETTVMPGRGYSKSTIRSERCPDANQDVDVCLSD